ncbi:MAG: bifunctional helix-turn-helix transcriptional regulator/GNAT family N-acetyltransferase [Chitinophagales bacterium]|nr:bifunctional helix-turn-helix transcriptional regulator/GNAT family N-acetyltransferase [Chitinophagales bacterium]
MTDPIRKLGHLAGATRFRRISEKLYLDGDKIYKEAGIDFKASWFPVFYVLSKSDAPLAIMEIANQIDFSHISVKNVLRELEKVELITIKVNPLDKRSKIVSLSKKGEQLLIRLRPLWLSFTKALKEVFDTGHPDLLNILDRIDQASNKMPINERMQINTRQNLSIVDYRPSLKSYFYELTTPWLMNVLDGELEEEDKFTLSNPDKAYIETGGFLFFAKYENEIVGCVVLKRLDEDSFEFAKLFIRPDYRKLGIATRLIERCITRCKENEAKELWLQTTLSMPQAHKLYYKLGFNDQPSPPQMDVLKRTDKIMCMAL